MVSIHQNLQIATSYLPQKPSFSSSSTTSNTYFTGLNPADHQSKLLHGMDQVHFGYAERPRIQREQDNSDSKVKIRLEQELLNSKIDWKKALESEPDPSIELALQYRLARNQNKADSEAREVVYIGRNAFVDSNAHQSIVIQSHANPELLKFMSPRQKSQLINRGQIINDIEIKSSTNGSPISRQHGNVAIVNDQYKYTDEHSLLTRMAS